MTVTRGTAVNRALHSRAVAIWIFPSHGVRPGECRRLSWHTGTLADAGRHCGLRGLDRLIEPLNRAAAMEAGMGKA